MKTIFKWIKRRCAPEPTLTEWDKDWMEQRLQRVVARHHEKLSNQSELDRLRREIERVKNQVEEQNDWP